MAAVQAWQSITREYTLALDVYVSQSSGLMTLHAKDM